MLYGGPYGTIFATFSCLVCAGSYVIRISIGGVVLATTYSLDYSVGFGEHQDSAIKNRVSWWLSYSKRDQAIEEEIG